MNKMFSFRRRSSLPAIYALVLAIILAITIIPCSEVQAAHEPVRADATVVHPDGSRRGRGPLPPFGNPARGYNVPPPPQERRRLRGTGGSARAGSDV
ncbi:unnamed protein product [Urochloa decumbens]|uniref:Secreted protein n=1 Tax=Urochloa decumbens TaxID=240449 RepID=A0ABC8ZV15_9POAL